MHAVRTPVFGIAFAVALLLLETLGLRAYIAETVEEQSRRPYRTDCTAIGPAAPDTVARY